MKKYKAFTILIVLILFSYAINSCEEENDKRKIDFRDSLIGTYSCLETFHDLDPSGGMIIKWRTDTLSMNREIIIEKSQDSSLSVIIGSYSFIATFKQENMFTCIECNGPPDYIKYLNKDSIRVYVKLGVTSSKNYYGKKQ